MADDSKFFPELSPDELKNAHRQLETVCSDHFAAYEFAALLERGHSREKIHEWCEELEKVATNRAIELKLPVQMMTIFGMTLIRMRRNMMDEQILKDITENAPPGSNHTN